MTRKMLFCTPWGYSIGYFKYFFSDVVYSSSTFVLDLSNGFQCQVSDLDAYPDFDVFSFAIKETVSAHRVLFVLLTLI